MEILQTSTHYFLHILFPGLIAYVFYRENFLKVWLILLATMLVDADHLLADPIFKSDRCSIGFHLLHSYWAIGIYVLLLGWKPARIVAIGLLLHMFTDWQDCWWMN